MKEILISLTSHVYGDDMLVIHNTSKPESTFEKSVMQLLIMSNLFDAYSLLFGHDAIKLDMLKGWIP